MIADQDDDGWTTVRYGGRRRRRRYYQSPSPDRYNADTRFAVRSGNYRRSYASVTRGPPRRDAPSFSASRNRQRDALPQQHRRWRPDYDNRRFQWDHRRQQDFQFRGRRDPGGSWWRSPGRDRRAPRGRTLAATAPRDGLTAPRSTDPDFKTKVRIMHKLIKAMHHLTNVSGEEPPITIDKMTQTLATLIKPAAPTDRTTDLICGNAKNWAVTTMLILRDHYADVIECETDKLLALPNPDWKEPFEIAANWARRNLGRRLLPETVEATEALLIARQADRRTMAPERASQDQMDATSSGGTCQLVPPPRLQGIQPAPLPLLQRNQLVVAAEVHAPPAASSTQATASPLLASAPQPMKTQTSRSMATMTDMRGDWSPDPQLDDRATQPATSPLPPPLAPTIDMDADPREQRPRRIFHTRSGENEFESLIQPASSLFDEDHPSTARGQLALDLDSDELEVSMADAEEPGCKSFNTVTSLLKNTVQSQIDFGRSSGGATHTTSDNTPSPPQTPTRRPIKHIRTTCKIKNWSLAVREKWLILGDSNVARFPPFQVADLQVDSFPGATFRHVHGVLSKIVAVPTVEKVILSLGLNNRCQAVQTSIKELQRLIKMAKTKFSQAEIWIPVISFSRSLPQSEQIHLHSLNQYIKSHCQFIPELSRSQFSTERDGLHWTHATATRLLSHWAGLVNCKPP